ncbi:MAG: UvrD-helicase domain-containing protein, partial [Prevotellaceae bacterium]|nr:UvrD-helicase domain-containing protein [Prevotellaceae bacterium]
MSVNYKPLTIYKASAGSGKTFTLAIEYINLLIANPHNFKYILAVTFTNKATQEMKQRILSQLYGIAHELPDSDSYFQRISELQPNLNEQEIRQHSADALQLIVHHYNLFRVETIDSFFQRILRNLSRELGLTANMQVSLNDTEVESQAVDNIIDN